MKIFYNAKKAFDALRDDLENPYIPSVQVMEKAPVSKKWTGRDGNGQAWELIKEGDSTYRIRLK